MALSREREGDKRYMCGFLVELMGTRKGGNVFLDLHFNLNSLFVAAKSQVDIFKPNYNILSIMMFNVAILFILSAVCVTAFRPIISRSTSTIATTSTMKMSFENEAGALPPVGFWDPLGR